MPLRLTGSLRIRPSLRAEMDACAREVHRPDQRTGRAGAWGGMGVSRAWLASLGVHLLDKAEGGVGHEQGEDDPEVQVRPEGEGEQAGDLNLRARAKMM